MATTLAFALVFIALDPWADAIAKGERSIAWRPARFAYFGALLAACLIFGNYGAAMFIYFQF
ncbi:MAG: hypothetical protein IPH53_05275 [Flavobacteriales bacterium]|nr:hypothetical protein [Flavobacteriales bacterium]